MISNSSRSVLANHHDLNLPREVIVAAKSFISFNRAANVSHLMFFNDASPFAFIKNNNNLILYKLPSFIFTHGVY